jgi:hypothetical protein
MSEAEAKQASKDKREKVATAERNRSRQRVGVARSVGRVKR